MKNRAQPNIYLVGFMGTGKSAIGRALAEELRFRFIDSDYSIEKAQKKKIGKIFEEDGEPTFRQMEREFIESGHPESGCVVSCGGGLVCREGMPELVKSKGVVICLTASPATIYERTRSNTNRPLLNVPDPKAEIAKLLDQRAPWYRKAGVAVLTDSRPISDITAHIIRIYKREATKGTAP